MEIEVEIMTQRRAGGGIGQIESHQIGGAGSAGDGGNGGDGGGRHPTLLCCSVINRVVCGEE